MAHVNRPFFVAVQQPSPTWEKSVRSPSADPWNGVAKTWSAMPSPAALRSCVVGKMLGNSGGFDRAIRIYEDVANVQARVLGTDHPDTLITRHGLAAAYEAAGRTSDAIAEYEWVTNRFEAVMGPGQSLTRAARDDLERTRQSHQPS